MNQVKIWSFTNHIYKNTHTFQVCDVHKPLLAVSKLCNTGHAVVFHPEWSFIENLSSQYLIKMQKYTWVFFSVPSTKQITQLGIILHQLCYGRFSSYGSSYTDWLKSGISLALIVIQFEMTWSNILCFFEKINRVFNDNLTLNTYLNRVFVALLTTSQFLYFSFFV